MASSELASERCVAERNAPTREDADGQVYRNAASCTAAVIDRRGKRLGHHIIETNGQVLVEFFKSQTGMLHVCIEEGTQAEWLVEILSPHVEQIVTLRVPESLGAKSDERDAFRLAEQLRIGAIDSGVYEQVGPFAMLRQLVKAHQMIVRDSARVQSRIKAVFRSRGVSVVGQAVYSAGRRAKVDADQFGLTRASFSGPRPEASCVPNTEDARRAAIGSTRNRRTAKAALGGLERPDDFEYRPYCCA